MSLPRFNSADTVLSLLQSQWSSMLDPLLRNPANSTVLLKSVQLNVGSNQINHKLGRKLQGWHIVRLRGSAPAIYDSQDSNRTPELTLALESSGSVVVDLLVF